MVTVQVKETDLMLELNTGASFFIISEATYSSLSHALSTCTGEKITLKGTVNFKVQYQMQIVTSTGGPNLMGHTGWNT